MKAILFGLQPVCVSMCERESMPLFVTRVRESKQLVGKGEGKGRKLERREGEGG
jgi:hypothetical protein